MKGATVPKPFNLSKGNKRKVEEPSVYVSMAQQIQQFQKRTPDRYHLRSRRSQERGVYMSSFFTTFSDKILGVSV